MDLKFIIFFPFVLLIIFSCSEINYSENRPPNVPESAVAIGGLDGWNWINCEITGSAQTQCDIYLQDGTFDRTSFLQVCLNLSYGEKHSKINQNIAKTIFLSNVLLFEYKPSQFRNSKSGEKALKYYNLLGVDENCDPASNQTELEYKVSF
uniref:hypothetical protein n=1 Tax=Ningiella ruwaisensis TaxID=2364274 RepID=UPI00109FE248|nr:hypothetical protein [Ningiella ruwaisensis]